MNLKELTVQNYRSVGEAYKLPLSRQTLLLGPNNEGKSNVLRAMVAAMRTIAMYPDLEKLAGPRQLDLLRHLTIYERNKDYPIFLQDSRPEGASKFTLAFALSKSEQEEFEETVHSKVNDTLPIQISITSRGVDFKVPKKGPGGPKLSAKAPAIARFVSQRVYCDYIPAIRTAHSARQVVDDLLFRELARLQSSAQFQNAMREIEGHVAPVLADLSANVQATVQPFVPSIKQVSFEISAPQIFDAIRSKCDIYVDDGTRTTLAFKGDGVQSLVALGIMRHASQAASGSKSVVLALEEPESHLHPAAVHELRSVLDDISLHTQIVVSSHCPLFVNRSHMAANVIVNKKKAVPARSLEEVRNALGVRASDNLHSAELVIVVEGAADSKILTSLLALRSPRITSLIKQGRLAFQHIGGCSKLNYALDRLQREVCRFHVFLDDDEAGNKAFADAKDKGLIAEKETTMTRLLGRKVSELEDLLSDDLCNQVVGEMFGIKGFRVPHNNAKAWSDRVRDACARASKPWSSSTEKDLKQNLADAVQKHVRDALEPGRDSPVVALLSVIESIMPSS